jgi:prepilin-type N-terminal cleavage/methylation domain-containing protein
VRRDRLAAGFTLLEVLLAMLILAAATAGTAALLTAGITHEYLSRRTTAAAALAQREVERLRDVPFGEIASSPAPETITVDGQTYQVSREVECFGTPAAMKRVRVEVTWTQMGLRRYQTEVVFTDLLPPQGEDVPACVPR